MKKLTAGIFATILGVTAMGAADAAVTSKGYVDAALATKANASEVSTLSSTVASHTTAITNLQTADTTLQGDIDELAGNVYTKTETNNLLSDKADKSLVGTLPEGTNASTVVGYVQEKTENIATSGDITLLQNRVKTIEDDYITATKLSTSQSEQNTEITNAYTTADATTLQTAKDYADAKDTAIAEAKKAGTDAAAAAEAAAAVAAENAKDIAVLEKEATSYELKANVSGAAETTTGKYVLTKIVGEGGVASFGWELIDREYTAGDSAPNGQ